jgi:hypothetical protein
VRTAFDRFAASIASRMSENGKIDNTPTRAGAEGDDSVGRRFLTTSRIAEIGALVAPLLTSGSSWIDRRKETVQILDDSALRRQISVDFSLRSSVKAVLEVSDGESIYAAPVFVLPKSPSSLRSFDLCDETGRSLSLISREDNAAISAAAILSLAARAAGHADPDQLPAGLRAQLREVAEAEADRGEAIARRLLSNDGTFAGDMAEFRKDPRLRGWLETVAHSSIVVVLFRSSGPRRKLVKLTFQEELKTEQRRLTRLGWAPYEVLIDSPRIEARSFHFEAEAPSGLRISKAQLTDSEHPEPVTEKGPTKRVHLYREQAATAGAGTAILSLDVAGPGFVSGAILASSLTLAALIGCLVRAPEIAGNPTSAPALLLVLPGLIASYVARPDRHALTTRLLSFARWLLLTVAFCAYIAAARVALAGTKPGAEPAISESGGALRTWLWFLTVIAGAATAGIVIGWFRGSAIRRWLKREYRFADKRAMDVPLGTLEDALASRIPNCPLPDGYTSARGMINRTIELNRSAWHGEWTLAMRLEEVADACLVRATLDYVELVPAIFVPPRQHAKEADRVRGYLDELTDWCQARRGDADEPAPNRAAAMD